MRRIALKTLYKVSLIIKGVDGVIELIGGLFFLFVKPARLHSIISVITSNELSEDPHDLVANLLRSVAAHLSLNTELLASMYLLAHGIVKLFLVYGLWKEKLWFFPYAFIVFGIFIGFEVARLIATFSILLIGALAFDLFIVSMVLVHFREMQSKQR